MKVPNSDNFSILKQAHSTAANWGESFIVFVSGLAVFEHNSKGAAQDFARGQVSGGKKRESVSIRSYKIPSSGL